MTGWGSEDIGGKEPKTSRRAAVVIVVVLVMVLGYFLVRRFA